MDNQVLGRDRLTFGVEEEFLLVDADSRSAVERADEVIDDVRRVLGEQVEGEFYLTQLETHSDVCGHSAQLRRDLAHCRAAAADAAARAGCLLVASPCAVLTSHPLPIRDDPRYLRIARQLGPVLSAAHSEISGCHIHLGTLGRGEALAVSAGLRPWLPVIEALATNSPFAARGDAGWASRRGYTYGRWPTVGPAPVLDEAGYERTVEQLVSAGVIIDRGMLYWYARPSEHLPTLEIRVADVNADLDTAVLLAVLLRGLATTLLAESAAEAALTADTIDDAQVAENHRRAARHGLAARLFDPRTRTYQPVPALLDALLLRAGEALEALGDLPFAAATLRRVLREGNGADRQRAFHAGSGSWTGLVDHLARETVNL